MIYTPIEVRNSPYGGRGLFLTADVSRGSALLEFDGPRVSWDEAVAVGQEDHVVPVGPAEYVDNSDLECLINHSCEPNTGFSTDTTLVALADIEAGVELTFDYSIVTIDGWTMECLCDSPSCRKTIGNFTDLDRDLQQTYEPILQPWMREYLKTR